LAVDRNAPKTTNPRRLKAFPGPIRTPALKRPRISRQTESTTLGINAWRTAPNYPQNFLYRSVILEIPNLMCKDYNVNNYSMFGAFVKFVNYFG
jgi:hypothetical protein